MDIERQILLATRRVPHGVVCLESALMFHGLLPTGPGPIWIGDQPQGKKACREWSIATLCPLWRRCVNSGRHQYKN